MVMNKMDKTIMKINKKKMKMPSKILKVRLMTITRRMTMTIFRNSSARSCNSCAPGRRCAQRPKDGGKPLKERGKENPPWVRTIQHQCHRSENRKVSRLWQVRPLER